MDYTNAEAGLTPLTSWQHLRLKVVITDPCYWLCDCLRDHSDHHQVPGERFSTKRPDAFAQTFLRPTANLLQSGDGAYIECNGPSMRRPVGVK